MSENFVSSVGISKSKIACDFRPVAHQRLLYKLFSYMIGGMGEWEVKIGFRSFTEIDFK